MSIILKFNLKNVNVELFPTTKFFQFIEKRCYEKLYSENWK